MLIGVGGIVGGGAIRTNGSLENVYNTGVIIGSDHYIAGISGSNDNTISQAYNQGTVLGYMWLGGIVGYNRSGTIENCYNLGDVYADKFDGVCTGGIVGHDETGNIRNVYNTGNISGGAGAIGGIIGHYNSSTLCNAYNTGTIVTFFNGAGTGGIIGQIDLLSGSLYYGVVENVYNIGVVNGDKSGDIVGVSKIPLNKMQVKNAYYQAGLNPGMTMNLGTAVTAADLLKKDTFAGFDFGTAGDNWRIYEGHTMPLLRVFLKPLQINASNATLSYNGSNQALSSALLPNTDMEHIWCATEIRNAGRYAAGDHLYWSDQQGYDITTTGEILMRQGQLVFTADQFTVKDNEIWPSFTGVVAGFVGSDSAAALQWQTPATAESPAGKYAINGSIDDPMIMNNYAFIQAPGNATALTLVSHLSPPPVEPPLPEPPLPEPPLPEPPLPEPPLPEPPLPEPPLPEPPDEGMTIPYMSLAREYLFRYNTDKKPAEIIDMFDPDRYGRRFYNDQFYQSNEFYPCKYFF